MNQEEAREWLEGAVLAIQDSLESPREIVDSLLLNDPGRQAILIALGVPENRTYPWHTIYVDAKTWSMAHPLTCDLVNCSIHDLASKGRGPRAPGVYVWDNKGWRYWPDPENVPMPPTGQDGLGLA